MGDDIESRTNKKITINTDLSLECMGEIQEYELKRRFN